MKGNKLSTSESDNLRDELKEAKLQLGLMTISRDD